MLPRTNFHKEEHSYFEKLFWGNIPIERAVSCFHYKHILTEVFQELKYRENPYIGTYLISLYARELKETNFFDDIDVIIPVPLHWMRRIKRGYNQAYYIAKGIKKETGIPINTNVLKRLINNSTQTRQMKFMRKENVENIFKLCHPEEIQGKHVLLVDDVATTGSTLIACGKALQKAQDVRISVLTLAFANQFPNVENAEADNMYIPIDADSLSKL